MARIRTIKPEFWANERLSALSEATHILAASLLNYADDYGYFNANPALVKAACSPLREPSVSIQCSLTELVEIGYIEIRKCADGKQVGLVVKFDEHQKVNRPTDSKLKDIFDNSNDSRRHHGGFTESSLSPHSARVGTGNREQGTGTCIVESSDSPRQRFEQFVAVFPSRKGDSGKAAAWNRHQSKFRDPTLASQILEGATRYRHFCDHEGKTGTEFVKQMTTWLNQQCWTETYATNGHTVRSTATHLLEDARAKRGT